MSPRALDLDPASREALELDAVLEEAAAHAATTPGRRAIRGASPLADREALDAEHAAVEEAALHLERIGRLLPGRLPDPEPAVRGLRVDDLVLDPLPLRDLASFLVASSDLKVSLSRLEDEGFDALRAIGRALPEVGALGREVARGVAPDGRLEDDASAELRRLRAAIVKTGERLRRQLESFVHDPSAASVVRDDFVTQRNGRFVIPVRADAPRPVEGIVHAASSSGQTLFVEPIASVEANNELVRLAEQEAAEQERIVRGWSEAYRARLPEIVAAIDGVARADSLQARAAFGRAIEGCRPRLGDEVPLRLDDARHPLLDRRLRESGSRCVPVSLTIDPYDGLLVLSGPNTGGKTVALKTAGLAVLMAQSGLPVTARAAQLPVFLQLRADIGDHQSIEADLSTFSGHVRAVARALEEAQAPALFLFDEIGTGTEPGEGAALAQAILERLLVRRITAIATTHHASLKAWAFSEPRVASAALEFDEATLRPTYRVLAGAAGASAGIEIAGRLGLEPSLVARARDLLGPEGRSAEAFMTRLRALTSEAEVRAEALRAAESELAALRSRLESAAREESAKRGEETARSLDGALREFRALASKELAGIQDTRERARVERAQVRAESRLREAARERRRALAPPSAPARPFDPVAGARVRIVSLEREGEIVSVRGDRIDVRMGQATFTVGRNDIASVEPLGSTPAAAPPARAPRATSSPRARGHDDEDRAGAPLELHLLGKTVDEALPEVDRFLDACTREGRNEARIVHGHGTGRLRTAIRRHLRGHPLVGAFRAGGVGEGGDGATVVTIR